MRTSMPLVAIVGRPNVGKSALFNRLLGEPRAIVAKEAGTTRDPVQAPLVWEGKSFWLVDTAGLQTAGELRKQEPTNRQIAADVADQVVEAQQTADVIIVVVDASAPLTQIDRQIAKSALKSDHPVILAANKSDKKPAAKLKSLGIKTVIETSAQAATGIQQLLDATAQQLRAAKPLKVADQRLAIVGRPNVGKSSLFNRLTGAKALVSPHSGTTRDALVARTKIKNTVIEITDTGGIRRPGARRGIEQFSYLRTLRAITSADVVALVLDATEPGVALDQKIAGLVSDSGRGLILVINKWDLVEDKETARLQLEQQLTNDFAYVWWAPLVFVSATSGRNAAKILEITAQILARHQSQIKTHDLNKSLNLAVSHHPPAGLRKRQPKLNYVTQTGSRPPTFTFFGNQVEWLHWSYKRYLESRLRGDFDFSGTPVRLLFRSKQRPKP